MNDFGKRTLNRLNKHGYRLIRVTVIPGEGDLPWCNATKAYVLEKNGKSCSYTFSDVLALANS